MATLAAVLATGGPAAAVSPAAAQAPVAMEGAACVVMPQAYDCNTAAVEAGDGVVWININTGIVAPCHYYVRDTRNSWPVRDGAVTGHYATRITGLYSWYRLELRWCTSGSSGYIR
ncbi:hypothetical protein FXF51_26050 [Nonomuraea sp. PA05]|uniref:hypothetical protein n=1 Tax=Nonomuraea sp. PA05 TaxID=2604466 RepID=UPI0011D8441A|nr:hypothetical protein [Nonomuraea sp. PA05]TYB62186.1 hypothetical protein FXF51_26050 [Nonomuraea sp. PA05]